MKSWRIGFNTIINRINDIYKNVDRYADIYCIEREKAENEIRQYQEILKAAALGEKTAVTYIIKQYSKIISSDDSGIDNKFLNEIINFQNLFENDIRIVYEILLSVIDISNIIDDFVYGYKIDKDIILKATRENLKKINEHFSKIEERLKLISYISYIIEYGQDAIDSLQYHDINEIGIISDKYIYIGYKGNKYYIDFLELESINDLENIQKKTTRNAVVPYDRQTPFVIGAKNNSNRITVAGYDAVPSKDILYYNERIFNLKNIKLEEMRDKYETIDNKIYEFLCLNQKGKGSFFVTGSDMGVGKSTFLLSLIEKIPEKWGIGIIDTQNELQAFKKFNKNIITIIENPKTTIAKAFELMLKMARDVLGVGEITKPEEVAELINAVLRLNSGAFATMHSFSAFEVVTNLRNLMLRTEMYNDAEVAEADISRGLDIIIHLERHPIDRKRIIVRNIVEIIPIDFSDALEKPSSNGNGNRDLRKIIILALEKYISNKCYKYNEIFRFNTETNSWDIINKPSKRYKGKLEMFLDKTEKNKLDEIFLEDNFIEV